MASRFRVGINTAVATPDDCPEQDCMVLQGVLSRPDVGWADGLCDAENPCMCRTCEMPAKDDGGGH